MSLMQQVQRDALNPITKLKEISMNCFWQKRNSFKLCFTFLLVFFFIVQPSSGAADKLKYIILLETMDVKEVIDRSNWFQVQMKELGYEEGINIELVVLKAKGSYQLAESLLKNAIRIRKPDLVVTNATLASQTANKVPFVVVTSEGILNSLTPSSPGENKT